MRKKYKMQEFHRNKKAELKLPEEPIKIVDVLISATGTYTNLFGDERTYNVYDKSDLRQIAEYLLAYCNANEN